MPAKTLKNKAVIDCTRGVSREDRAIARRNRRESLSSIRNHPRRVRKQIEKMLKLEEIRMAAIAAFDAKYGSLDNPDRVVPESTFQEEPFDIDDHYIEPSVCSSVVSLALFDGDKMLFACSGTVVPCGTTKLHLTRFVTSARLVDEFNSHRNSDDKLRVQVRLHDNELVDGFLGLYDEDIAIVTSFGLLDVLPVDLVQKTSHCDLVAAGRAFTSGKLMSSAVLHTGEGCFDTYGSIKGSITKAGLGGPIFCSKIFVGVIVNHDTGTGAKFLPKKSLRKRLQHFGILTRKAIQFRGYSLPSGVSSIVPSGFMRRINWLRSMGYPMPPPLVLELNGELLNTFEEMFGDIRAWKGYPFGVSLSSWEHVWPLLPKEIVTKISRRVVSLASFNGDVRFFACTGLLIKWSGFTRPTILTSASLVRTCEDSDKIDGSLRIEVFLPPNQRVQGRLIYYHSSYNIAIVSPEKCFCAVYPEDLSDIIEESSKRVVAIGREPNEGLLMASKGEVIDKSSKLGDKDIKLSTCKIKKAGIGGPLINFDGIFVGMNFYDGSGETPFLPRNKIVELLTGSVTLPKRFGLPLSLKQPRSWGRKIRWPVPKPYWCHGELDVDMYDIPPPIGRCLQ